MRSWQRTFSRQYICTIPNPPAVPPVSVSIDDIYIDIDRGRYKQQMPGATPQELWNIIKSDVAFTVSTLMVAERCALHSEQVWTYRFDGYLLRSECACPVL